MRQLVILLFLTLVSGFYFLSPAAQGTADTDERAGPLLTHAVFFDLKEKTDQAREKLVRLCEEYLSRHDGTVYFSAGTLAADLDRPVNDREFDVCLIVVFRNKAFHDRYQTHPRHLKFIELGKDSWERVRVFDSYSRRGRDADLPDGRVALPDPAAGFAGMIRARVLQVRDDGVVVRVLSVTEEWRHSEAKNSRSLVDKPVLVQARQNGTVRAFLRSLREEDEVVLDVANQAGEVLTLLELTEEQRLRVRD